MHWTIHYFYTWLHAVSILSTYFISFENDENKKNFQITIFRHSRDIELIGVQPKVLLYF